MSRLLSQLKRNRKARGGAGTRESGQNLVEFALVLPVVILLMVGGYNLGVLLLRITDAGYIAQDAAVMAARYGGTNDSFLATVEQRVSASFLSGADGFIWRLETRDPGSGAVTCRTNDNYGGGGGPDGLVRYCTCDWGQEVTVIASYHYDINIGPANFSNVYQTEKSVLCWRGTVPDGASDPGEHNAGFPYWP